MYLLTKGIWLTTVKSEERELGRELNLAGSRYQWETLSKNKRSQRVNAMVKGASSGPRFDS